MSKCNEMVYPSFFSILTADVRYNKDLSANEKILFCEITALTNNKGFCSATNVYFSSLYDVDVRTIQRWISNLAKYNFIEISFINGFRQIKIVINSKKKKTKKDKKVFSKPSWLIEYEENFDSTIINL